jgi:hypothetical protein
MAVTMTLHNLPEGFAVRAPVAHQLSALPTPLFLAQVAFASFTDFGPLMAMAVALHNIPEGLIVAGAPLLRHSCMFALLTPRLPLCSTHLRCDGQQAAGTRNGLRVGAPRLVSSRSPLRARSKAESCHRACRSL